jgi:Beta-ketoacyl synthase, C-terminal domain/KR domain/Beta-ketoacyl synthase, N-terminal domain/Polyketide synthase dehydratase
MRSLVRGVSGPVAVVGMGIVAPGVNSPDELWQALRQEIPQFRTPTRFAIDPIYSPNPEATEHTFSRESGYITTFKPHPALAVELARGEWDNHDTETVWLRHCLLQALDGSRPLTGQRVSCYLSAWPGALLATEDTALVTHTARALSRDLAATDAGRAAQEQRLRARLRRRFPYSADDPELLGPESVIRRAALGLLPEDTDWLTVSAACASALYAIDIGMHSLAVGECDVAVCGSLQGMGRIMAVTAARFGGVSRAGDVRAFDADADGTMFAEAASVVVLRRWEDAEGEGDRILAALTGSGLASDGRGRAISAVNPAGLRRAVDAAWEAAGVSGSDVDWVLAHGTGTPLGDTTEINTYDAVAGPRGLWCSSNKSLLGHATWAAGGVSVIHAVCALRQHTIPAQQRFTRPHKALSGSLVRIADTSAAWRPDPDRPRVAAVTGLGVGGANAHLVIQDRPAATRPPAAPTPDEPLVLTAWTVWLPGTPDTATTRQWLAGLAPPPPTRFGPNYPASPLAATRLPPVVIDAIDRSHRMALDVAHRFVAEHGELWHDLRDAAGLYAACQGVGGSWPDLAARIGGTELTGMDWTPEERAALDTFLGQARARQAITEETMTGSVPHLAVYRIAHRWDIHGPTLCLDTGESSAYRAAHLALGHLRAGRVDLALVFAFNDGSAAPGRYPNDITAGADGAFLLAFTRESVARQRGWPMLAEVTARTRPGRRCRIPLAGQSLYGAAQGAVELLRAVVRCESAEVGGDYVAVTVAPVGGDHAVPVSSPGQASRAGRWALTWRRADIYPHPSAVDPVPAGGIVLTNTAQCAAELADAVQAAGAVLLSTDPRTFPEHGLVVDRVVENLPALAVLGCQQAQVRVVARIRHQPGAWLDEDPSVTRLLETCFLTAKALGPRLAGAEVTVACLDPLLDGQPHPDSALFTGFVRALAWEVTEGSACAVVTDAPSALAAAVQVATETAAGREPAVVHYRSGARYVPRLCPVSLPPITPTRPLSGKAPVVVAVGGAGGITPAVLTQLANTTAATLWILGRSDPDTVPEYILAATDTDQARLRTRHLRTPSTGGTATTVGQRNALFDRWWRARTTAATVRRLRDLLGQDRVHYLPCDITDPAAVATAAATIIARHPRIDILIDSAMHKDPGRCDTKSLASFRQVLDTRVAGHRNLRRYLADRVDSWCAFGSSITVFGLPGETDYTAGSEFLATAARYESRVLQRAVRVPNWGLWEEAGSSADPATRTRLSRFGITTGMSTSEGVGHCLTELATSDAIEASPVYLTAEDRATAEDRHPDLLSVLLSAENTPEPGRLSRGGEATEKSDRHATWTWSPQPTDRYLLEHLVFGHPTLPAMCVVAMAVEAAGALLQDIPATSVHDLRLDHYIRADPRTPNQLSYRVHAERLTSDTVRVQVLSDVVTRTGVVLVRDRCHAQAVVHVGAPLASARTTDGVTSPDADGVRHCDPCGQPGSPIQLTGAFQTLTGIIADRHRASARYQPTLDPTDPITRACVPVLLLDSVSRMCCLPVDADMRIEPFRATR